MLPLSPPNLPERRSADAVGPANMPHHCSEDEIIELIKRRSPGRNRLIETGIGDDAAVVRAARPGELWVVTTDMLLEGIDFRRHWATAAQIGHKALAANLSDLAAMGAVPRFYTVALALPRGISRSWITGLFGGIKDLADRYGAVLIGGDLSSSRSGICISITAIGAMQARRPVCRSGGRPGDLLCVTGILGCSAAGLKLLRSGVCRGRRVPERLALQVHRIPEPRCHAGIWLAACGLVHCMMDLSDGLSVDLPRLCRASRTGATIHAHKLPIFQGSAAWGCDPVTAALHGGEDFELLFAVAPKDVATLTKRYPKHLPPLSVIGALTAGAGVRMVRSPGARPQKLAPGGFDHFRRS